MNIEELRNFCLSKKEVTEEFPFDKNTLVFKVNGKMFLLTDIENYESVNLKCNPEESVLLQEKYMGIVPGYHMNKKHWITVTVDSDVSNSLLVSLINDSYELVSQKIKKNKIKK